MSDQRTKTRRLGRLLKVRRLQERAARERLEEARGRAEGVRRGLTEAAGLLAAHSQAARAELLDGAPGGGAAAYRSSVVELRAAIDRQSERIEEFARDLRRYRRLARSALRRRQAAEKLARRTARDEA